MTGKKLDWNERVSLLKHFFEAQFVCFIFFGGWIVIPWNLWNWWFDDGAIDTTTSSPPGWGTRITGLVFGLIIFIYIVRNWTYTLEYIEDFFTGLKKITKNWSPVKIAILLFAMIFMMSLWFVNGLLAYYLSVFVLCPLGFACDEYLKIKNSVSSEPSEEE